MPAVEETLTIDPPAPQLRQRRANRPDVAHHVQLPHLVPLRVRDRIEVGLVCEPDVVYQAIDRADLTGLANELRGSIRICKVAGHVQGLADSRCTAATARDHPRPLLGEHPRDGAADPARRAGDDADAIAEPEIHGRLAYSP